MKSSGDPKLSTTFLRAGSRASHRFDSWKADSARRPRLSPRQANESNNDAERRHGFRYGSDSSPVGGGQQDFTVTSRRPEYDPAIRYR